MKQPFQSAENARGAFERDREKADSLRIKKSETNVSDLQVDSTNSKSNQLLKDIDVIYNLKSCLSAI